MERARGPSDTKRAEIDMGELEEILRRAAQALPPQDLEKLRAVVETFAWLQGEISRKNASLSQLRQALFGKPSTEKTREVCGERPKESGNDSAQGTEDVDGEPPQRALPEEDVTRPEPKGHGRNAAADYPGAERVKVKHESLKAGDPCPETGCDGKVYPLAEPRVVVCVRGHAPLSATIYEREALRCWLCGRVFVAGVPLLHNCKYDETAAAMIGLLKYGTGLPFHRLGRLEGNLGIPLPAATQWEIVEEAAKELAPAHDELTRQAAQGEVIHNDDTSMTILSPLKENRTKEEGERYGTFTTGFVASVADHRIALYRTGRNHAGENMTELLKEREGQRPPAIQMCDGLDRNEPDERFKTILANCLGHGRRHFVDVVADFPDEVRHVLETLRDVFRHDAHTRRAKMSPEDRLRYHQEHSRPLMDGLKAWFEEQFAQKKIEPNSGLGDAIRYMTKRWAKLTLFLTVPGAPLDNNICERILKKAILHRKNALFFKTQNGARVGDIFMSLIHTAELNGVNAFHYLTELLRHAKLVADDAEAWMPWNYRETMAAARSP